MMHFISENPEPENDNNFWYLIIATAIVVVFCLASIIIKLVYQSFIPSGAGIKKHKAIYELTRTTVRDQVALFIQREMEQKTHWKKNLDPRYISGEDLKAGLNGLAPEMVVSIANMQDAPTFDQSMQKEVSKTALWLNDATGKKIYKPVILNVTNAKTLSKEFGSDFIEDWYGKQIVLFAQADRRFGHVARFKKYYAPAQVDPKKAIELLSASTNLEILGQAWNSLSAEEKKLSTVIAKKDELKTKLA